MRHTVPQFIERETPIVGPLTFRQLIIVGIGGVICVILYFSLGAKSFTLFLFLSFIIMGTCLALTFVNVGGKPLISFLPIVFKFLSQPKRYLWKRKEISVIKIYKKESKT